MKITILPSGPEPKQLTARALPKTLLEHRLAFLAANNKGGFAQAVEEEPVFGVNTPGQYLLESRCAARALMFEVVPLKITEYISLREQRFS